jgi:hypothetical protein
MTRQVLPSFTRSWRGPYPIQLHVAASTSRAPRAAKRLPRLLFRGLRYSRSAGYAPIGFEFGAALSAALQRQETAEVKVTPRAESAGTSAVSDTSINVIVALYTSIPTRAAKAVAGTIPIIFFFLPRRRRDRMSNVLLAQADLGCHAALSRSMALRVVCCTTRVGMMASYSAIRRASR